MVFLPTTITQLEKQKLPLHESIATVKSVENKLEHIIDEAGTAIKEKLKNVLEKNRGFNDLKKISSILIGEATSMEGLPEYLNGNDLAHFKYAPITSSDVERSFSRYKNVLTDNRRSIEIENIKKVLVIQCNTFTGMTVTIIYMFNELKKINIIFQITFTLRVYIFLD